MKILRYNELTDVPWKNGGGTTRNIATGQHGAQMVWRISRADVTQDGPFSNFAGLERILTVVSDGHMILDYAGGALQALPWQPVRFDGDLPVCARLTNGSITDLNLMFDPTLCIAEVVVHQGPITFDLTPPSTGITALHVLDGRPAFGQNHLHTGDTAFLQSDSRIVLAKGDAVLEIAIEYLDQSRAITLCIADL
ncbi:HutD/Ves family protein [Yoonia sp. MH D7]